MQSPTPSISDSSHPTYRAIRRIEPSDVSSPPTYRARRCVEPSDVSSPPTYWALRRTELSDVSSSPFSSWEPYKLYIYQLHSKNSFLGVALRTPPPSITSWTLFVSLSPSNFANNYPLLWNHFNVALVSHFRYLRTKGLWQNIGRKVLFSTLHFTWEVLEGICQF